MPNRCKSKEEAFLLATQELDELELIFAGMYGVAVPFDAPLDFKARVLAAVGSYAWGNKSVDNHLKRHGDLYQRERPTAENRVMFRALIGAKSHVQEFAHVIKQLPEVSVNTGRFISEACLLRLQASFQSSVLLVRQGFVFEAGAICRLILEQLAWAFAIHSTEDDSFLQTEPNHCIAKLKLLLPTAGRFYGSLSHLTHVHPNMTREYLHFEGSQASVLLSVSHLRWAAVFDILMLADWYHLVGEYVLFEHLTATKSIHRDVDGKLTVHASRPFVQKILSHAQAAQSVGVPIEVHD